MNDHEIKGLLGYAILCLTAGIIHAASMVDPQTESLTVIQSVERASAIMDAADKLWNKA